MRIIKIKNIADEENTFPSKPDYGTDIDVLTTFKTLPKRFMVWDKQLKKFCSELLPNSNHKTIFDIWEMDWWLDRDLAKDHILVQSTNLFDKDGKEIFEGAILEDFDEYKIIVEYDNGCFYGRQMDGKRFRLHEQWFASHNYKWNYEAPKVIGHILSNPNLMEEWG